VICRAHSISWATAPMSCIQVTNCSSRP
jgi:hypothetical protein